MDSMNRMRMQSSPRPASGRRVVARKRTRPDDTKNCVRKLFKREISRAGNLAFNRTNLQEKFWNFHLQEEFDTHDPKAHHFLKLPFRKKRFRIVEIGAARDIVFAFTHSGICATFSRGSAFSALSRAAQCSQCISMDTSKNTGEFENPASTHTPQNYTYSTLTSGGSRKPQAVSNKYRSG